MRKLTACLLVTMTAMVVAGCAEAPTKPPAGAVTADAGFPSPGTKFMFRKTDVTDANAQKLTTYTETVQSEEIYKGTPVYRETDGVDVKLFNKRNCNWMATLRGGVQRYSASPDDGTFSWPLFVGKQWTANLTYHDHVRERSWSPVVSYWKVASYEDVTVPAGTFKAFRLEQSPGTNNGTSVTDWYAPELKAIVKRIFERSHNHYLGYGKFITELVKIEK